MNIRTRTTDPDFVRAFFEREDVAYGDRIQIPGTAAVVTYSDFPKRGAFGVSSEVSLILTFAGGVASSLVASWLYNKLSGKVGMLTIDRTEVKVDRDEIHIAIERIAGSK